LLSHSTAYFQLASTVAAVMFLAHQLPSFVKDPADPLTRHFLTPPAGETPEQRAQRESQQASASKQSREIDEWLRAEKAAKDKDKRKRKVQVILVGKGTSPQWLNPAPSR
jgi:hypothetical protein